MIHFEYHYGDHFETPETVERSDYYNVTFHPHTRFDGANPILGATTCANATTNFRAAILDRIAETNGLSPVAIDGSYEISAGRADISATFRLVDPADLYVPRASFIVVEDNVHWCCGSFGVDTWQGVTRTIYDEWITFEQAGDEVMVSAEIPLDPSWNPEELRIVAVLQDYATQEIFQGRLLQRGVSSVPDPAPSSAGLRIVELAPNPFRSDVAVRLAVPAGSMDARVEIVDPRGRKVADLGARLDPGEHELRWDGLDAEGTRLGSGVYFVRLTGGGAARTAKVVITR